MLRRKKPAPFFDDPEFGELGARAEDEIKRLRSRIEELEDRETQALPATDEATFARLELHIRNLALTCRVPAIFANLPLPYVNGWALPRRVRADGRQFKIVAGYNLHSARPSWRGRLLILSDLFLISNEGTLHTLRADRVGAPVGRWGDTEEGLWTPWDHWGEGVRYGVGERRGHWPWKRSEFGPFDPECLVNPTSQTPYWDLSTLSGWFHRMVHGAQEQVRDELTKKLRVLEARQR